VTNHEAMVIQERNRLEKEIEELQVKLDKAIEALKLVGGMSKHGVDCMPHVESVLEEIQGSK